MMFKIIIFAVSVGILLFSDAGVEGKTFKRCELVQTLRKHGIPEGQLGTWICIAKHESNYDTKAINHNTGDYGIFQISHLYWCKDGNTPGNGCGITCRSLLVDDISGSIKCAQTVYHKTPGNGFTAWTTYKDCRGDQSGYVKGC